MARRAKSERLLPLIGAFKLVKAATLLLVAAGAHKLLRGDIAEVLDHWARAIRIDPESKLAHDVISRVTGMSPTRMKELSIGTLLYGLVFAVEGVGLLLHKRWAEYITIATTVTFLPIEIYEVVREPTALHVGLLVANVLIVAYLVFAIRRKRN